MRITIISMVFLAACVPQADLVKTKNEMTDLRTDVKAVKSQVQDMQGLQKRLDAIDSNVKGLVDVQKTVADHGARFDQLATDIQILQGKLEENNFRIAELAQKLDDKTYKISELVAKVEELDKKVKSLPEGGVAPPDKEKKPEAKSLSPTEAYQQAKTDYDKGNYDLAIAGFQKYLTQFPDSSKVDSAQYWIGECWYSKKEYEAARQEFLKVLKAYPRSDKAPGARLKIGFSYLNEKNTIKARESLHKVIKDYPHAKEAELAKEKLKTIGK